MGAGVCQVPRFAEGTNFPAGRLIPHMSSLKPGVVWAALGALLAAIAPARAQEEGAAEAVPEPALAHAPVAPRDPVWEMRLRGFTDADYARAVEQTIASFEQTTGRRLTPGRHNKVGLKIYAESGPGLQTPIGLTKAVIAALERRGFKHDNIFLVGLSLLRMRQAGYLPSLVNGETPFPGTPIYVLESGKFYNPTWFYDSPLPSRFDPLMNLENVEQTARGKAQTTTDEDRKSFLATPLFLDADFWINLPVYTDHAVLGVNGALVNATLWNASNTLRFLRSPANAPAAVAEMAAIPELRRNWVFTIASLQSYQFIGGPFFNSLYTVSEPLLLLSADPVMLDTLMLQRINSAREHAGFQPISPDDALLLQYAEQLGVGSRDTKDVRWIRLRETRTD